MERSSTLREIFKFSITHLYFFSSFAFHLGSVVTLSQALSRSGNLVSAGNGGWKPAFRGRGGTATVKNNKIRMKRISCSIPQTLLFREISLCSSSRREIKKKRKKFHPTPQNDTLDILDILFSTIDRDSRSWTFLSLCLSSSKKENLPSKAKKFGRWKKVKQQFPTPSVRNHRLFSFRTSPRLYSGGGGRGEANFYRERARVSGEDLVFTREHESKPPWSKFRDVPPRIQEPSPSGFLPGGSIFRSFLLYSRRFYEGYKKREKKRERNVTTPVSRRVSVLPSRTKNGESVLRGISRSISRSNFFPELCWRISTPFPSLVLRLFSLFEVGIRDWYKLLILSLHFLSGNL